MSYEKSKLRSVDPSAGPVDRKDNRAATLVAAGMAAPA
jgi:hypothetical protein